MLRTYKSKKETGGGLDSKEVLLTMHEKSTAFDAFYIQNIKQTKREFSCMGSSKHYGAASNKVRKRKYVKRIVKDAEPPVRDSPSHSTYLTPDKSIHVNKALDPFDQLLNSSPPIEKPNVNDALDSFDQLVNLTPKIERSNLNETLDSFDQLLKLSQKTDGSTNYLFNKLRCNKRRGKSYTRKKVTNKKKANYLNSDSTDSNKENSDDNADVTDIGTHRLLIEKESNVHPKSYDDSINNIIKNISLLNDMKTPKKELNNSTMCNRKDSIYNIHRLSRGLLSPVLRNSLMSSTPFREKHRGKSMFKFSPISIKDLENRPNCEVLAKGNMDNDSIIFINNDTEVPKVSQDNHQSSPIIPHKRTVSHFISKSLLNSIKNNPQESFMPVDNLKSNVIIQQNPSQSFTVKEESSKNKVCSFHANETKPYLSFGDKSINSKVSDKDESSNNHESLMKSPIIECSVPSKPFLGFSKLDVSFDGDNGGFVHNNLTSEKNETNNSTLSNLQDFENESMYDTCNSDESSLKCSGTEKSIDICNSYESSVKDRNEEPIVKIGRMNNSVFNKYYQKMTDFESIVEVNQNISNTNNDVIYINDNNGEITINFDRQDPSDNESEQSQYRETDFEENSSNNSSSTDPSYTPDDISSNDSCIKSNSNDDDKCVSYVTTRRRIKTVLDTDDFYSSVSTDCDRAVVSNNIILHSDHDICNSEIEDAFDVETRKLVHEELDSYVEPNEATNTTQEMDAVATTNTTQEINAIAIKKSPTQFIDPDIEDQQEMNAVAIKKSSTQFIDPDIEDQQVSSRAGTRQSSRLSKQCRLSQNSDVLNSVKCGSEPKMGIVLQPGKKWERSLSVYKRMTMMNDYFDHSMLDEEPLDNKGRKYRQSVISTMEMQEHQGSLHNESLNSCRSTFVSKPCRSTIKIVKELNSTRVSWCTTVYDDLKGFLSEDCDDTVVDLSKLSIADSDCDVTVLEKVNDDRITTARDYVLRRCNQKDVIFFDESYPDTVLKNCRKIGEGVYGEVFLYRGRDGHARVMKVVPVAGAIKVNGEHQKDFHEIISEIVIAMELSALRTPIADIELQLDEGKEVAALDLHEIENATDVFNEVLAVKCVYGSYPSRLLDLWDLYDECKGSENDNPAILPPEQQYIVLELANAGEDLESFQFNNAEQAHALFLQVAFGLAVGEEAFQFEHRDLHWGNVLIAPTDQKFATYIIRGRLHRVPRCGVAATIIDYSLSRVSLPLGGASDSAVLYNDLATDETLFDALGDYQFQVYRDMRDRLGNDWKNFEPYTNILWLHYTADKMITALRYKRANTKVHKHYISKIKDIKNRILNYGSAAHFVHTDNEY